MCRKWWLELKQARMDGWMTCDFTSFNSFSSISGQWVDDNERPYAMKRFPPSAGLELETARPAGQRLTL